MKSILNALYRLIKKPSKTDKSNVYDTEGKGWVKTVYPAEPAKDFNDWIGHVYRTSNK